MDNASIEEYAANAVGESMLETGILHPYISKNDKTPSWDGHVILYKSSSKNKDNIDGSVGVQVKGVGNSNHDPKEISHSAEVANLKNYLHNSGVIYFVVRIHKTEPSKRKIYYTTLTPVKLAHYLDGIENQKTKTIRLKEFPTDKNKKTAIVANFLKDSRRQASHVETGFISLDEVMKNKVPYIPHIDVLGYNSGDRNDSFSAVFENETYMYVSVEGSNTLIPIDTPLTINDITETIEETVSIDDNIYYDRYQRVRSAGGTATKIGDSTTFGFEKASKESENAIITSKISITPYLRKRAKDIRFLIGLAKGGKLCFGGAKLGIISLNDAPPDFISMNERRLAYDSKILQMLKILHIEEDIKTDELSDSQKRDLEVLVRAFVDGQNVLKIPDIAITSMFDLKLPSFTIRLLVVKNDDGTITLHDFFNTNRWQFSRRYENGERQIIPPYSALSKADYLSIVNIDYEDIVDSYKDLITVNPKVFESANNDLLNMLLAYDEQPNPKLIKTAHELALWIYTDGEDIMGKNIMILNYLQIIKRERVLSKDEEKQLFEITVDVDATEQEKIGAHLLLGNQKSAEMHWDRLTAEDKNTFKNFPIYKFWLPFTE